MQHLSECGREDQFMAFAGTGGLLNLDKIRASQKVLDTIAVYQKRSKITIPPPPPPPADDAPTPQKETLARNHVVLREQEEWDWSQRALRATTPTTPGQQSTNRADHQVQLFDLCGDGGGLDWRTIKILRNGTTVIHCEPDGSRGVPVLLRLEKSHGTLTWSRTPWNGNLVSNSGDLSLFSNPDVDVTQGLKMKYGLGSGPSPPGGTAGGFGGAADGEVSGGGIEEGYLDVAAMKEVALSCREGDFISIARRYGKFAPGHLSAFE